MNSLATLDQAKRYLERVVPWPPEQQGKPAAFANVHYTFVPQNHDPNKPLPWCGRACRSLEEALKAVRWAAGASNVRDIYLCLSTQREPSKERTGKLGQKFYLPHRSRDNVFQIKTLYVDVDFKGGEHGYNTQSEAVKDLARFLGETKLPKPTLFVQSGGGLHVYWTLSRALPLSEWQPMAYALAEATKRHGLKCDTQCTVDGARVLRIPATFNRKLAQPRPVTLGGDSQLDHTPEAMAKALEPYKTRVRAVSVTPEVTITPPTASVLAKFKDLDDAPLGAGIEPQYPPIKLADIAVECAFVRDAIATAGAAYNEPMWNLTTLISTFTEGGRADAHLMGTGHPGYTKKGTDERYERKLREKNEKGLGWPSCSAIRVAGCTACQSCKHFGAGKTPFHFAPSAVPSQHVQSPPAARAEAISFADPWADFLGPRFPVNVLPWPVANFVAAEHHAMGADPSPIAMAALTVVAGAMHAETHVRAGDGWFEKPIIWTTLVGDPSAMKSPIIQKSTSPLRKIDHQRDATYRQQYAAWKQAKAAGAPPSPCPTKPGRALIQDATSEKVAEILSRDPAGALMVHDELAAWLGSFERYSGGQASRGFHLQTWNGGPYLKDRVGQGVRDESAEIRVDNLALCVLGGIQPDRLAALRDLTSDGLLQRFLPVLMRAAERGDEKHPVLAAENDYSRLIDLVQGASPHRYEFDPAATDVRTRVLDRLFELEQVEGFSSALIGAIGKLKGYYARLALVLHAAGEHAAIMQGQGRSYGADISRSTAEAAEHLLFDFLLPHIFGLYDVIADSGRERETVRAIASFILASDKDRLRPSDLTTGVRKLRGEPQTKVAEWASRFCAMGWLLPENDNTPTPSAWLVVPGLREHFAERREHARIARAHAHAILSAGGRRP
jgi:hypothetical protein